MLRREKEAKARLDQEAKANREAIHRLQIIDKQILETAIKEGLVSIEKDKTHRLHNVSAQLQAELKKEILGDTFAPGDSKSRDFPRELADHVYQAELKDHKRTLGKDERKALALLVSHHTENLLHKSGIFENIKKNLIDYSAKLATLDEKIKYLQKQAAVKEAEFRDLSARSIAKAEEKKAWEAGLIAMPSLIQEPVGPLSGEEFKRTITIPYFNKQIERLKNELVELGKKESKFPAIREAEIKKIRETEQEMEIEKQRLSKTAANAEKLESIKLNLEKVVGELQKSLQSVRDQKMQTANDEKTMGLLIEFNQILQQVKDTEKKITDPTLNKPATEWLKPYLPTTPDLKEETIHDISDYIRKQRTEEVLRQEHNMLMAKLIAGEDQRLEKDGKFQGNTKLKANQIYEEHAKSLQLEKNRKKGVNAIQSFLEGKGAFKHPESNKLDIGMLKALADKLQRKEDVISVRKASSSLGGGRRPSSLGRSRSRLNLEERENAVRFNTPEAAFQQGYNDVFAKEDVKNIAGGREFEDAYTKGRVIGSKHAAVPDSKPVLQKAISEWRTESKLLRSKSSVGRQQSIISVTDDEDQESTVEKSKEKSRVAQPVPTSSSAQVFSHLSAAAPSAAPGPASTVAARGKKYEVPSAATEFQGDSKPSLDKQKRKSASEDQDVMPGQVNVESAYASGSPGDARKHRKTLTAVPEADMISPLPNVTTSSHKRKTMTRNVPTLDASGQVRRPSEISSAGKSASESSPSDSFQPKAISRKIP